MYSDEAMDHERKGADAGINPMFGDWQHVFDFAPISYAAGSVARAAFRAAIQAELTNRFFFTNEVRLEIVLHLDVQTVLETDSTADVDNYAKAILDGLKGPDGILLDDTQVQALTIYWIDSYGQDRSRFEIRISASPDDFMLKPLAFYEMPDGLWYPYARNVWSADGEAQSDLSFYAGLLVTESIAAVQKQGRHLMRQSGLSRLRAYQAGQYLASSARGFHKSRVDGGFAMHDRHSWQAELKAWRDTDGDGFAQIEEIIANLRSSREELAKLFAGKLP